MITCISVPDQKFNIVFPIGGFGNHVRWLLLLDPAFKFLVKGSEKSFNDQRGADWPSYNDYVLNNWKYTSLDIKNEIAESFDDFDCIDSDTKLKFIQKKIYPSTRTWHNWLSFEWAYRKNLHTLIEVDHRFVNIVNKHCPTVILTIAPDLAYNSYLKFNSNLNNCSKDSFKSNIMQETKENINNCQNKVCILNVDILFQPTLDKKFYYSLITSLGLSDQFKEADYVHRLWFQAHKRSEQEFVRDITTMYTN